MIDCGQYFKNFINLPILYKLRIPCLSKIKESRSSQWSTDAGDTWSRPKNWGKNGGEHWCHLIKSLSHKQDFNSNTHQPHQASEKDIGNDPCPWTSSWLSRVLVDQPIGHLHLHRHPCPTGPAFPWRLVGSRDVGRSKRSLWGSNLGFFESSRSKIQIKRTYNSSTEIWLIHDSGWFFSHPNSWSKNKKTPRAVIQSPAGNHMCLPSASKSKVSMGRFRRHKPPSPSKQAIRSALLTDVTHPSTQAVLTWSCDKHLWLKKIQKNQKRTG